MKAIQKLWTWYYLLNKRYFKRYSFLLILLLIPLLVKGMQSVAEQESGMLKIVLCQEDSAEKISMQMIDTLLKEEGILSYTRVESITEAIAEVENGNADIAWIFAEDIEDRIKAYAAGTAKKKELVTVIEREDNVALQLSREKLYSVIYPILSYELYQEQVKKIPELGYVEEEQLKAAYRQMTIDDNLFQFSYADEKIKDVKEPHYLLMPMRGLLSLVVMLSGLAGAMYQMQDAQSGKFTWLSQKQKKWFSLFYYVPIVINAALAVGIALMWTGMIFDIKREILVMAIYLVAVIGFCELMRQWTGKLSVLGASIPLIILGMFVLCPIFLDLKNFRPIQYLLPPFYYLMSLYNDAFIKKSIIYLIGIYVVLFITKKWKKRAE